MRTPSRLDRIGPAGLLLSAMFSGCGALGERAPMTLRTPELVVLALPHAGTSLTGPTDSQPRLDAAVSLGVRQRALWVESPITTSGSLDPNVSLVIGPNDPDPLRAVARRARDIGFASSSDAVELLRAIGDGRHGRTSIAWEKAGPLDPGTTFRVDARSTDADDTLALVIDAARAAGSAEARIALQIGGRGATDREKLVLAYPLHAAAGPIAFVFTRSAARDEPAALVVVLEIDDGAALAADPSTARNEVVASAAAAAQRSRELTRAEEERREIRGIVADLSRDSDRRARLIFLASSCGAPLALDIALIAQDKDLLELADAVKAAIPEGADRARAAWPIERAAWLLLGRKSAAGEIAPELSGVLARQGGEAARFPGAIEDLVRGIDDVAGLTQRLIAENRILLEDASPSSRLRAYDWLAVRGIAPGGFDPFGTLSERRAALRKIADAEEAARADGKRP